MLFLRLKSFAMNSFFTPLIWAFAIHQEVMIASVKIAHAFKIVSVYFLLMIHTGKSRLVCKCARHWPSSLQGLLRQSIIKAKIEFAIDDYIQINSQNTNLFHLFNIYFWIYCLTMVTSSAWGKHISNILYFRQVNKLFTQNALIRRSKCCLSYR